jgi:hypothetical protein
MMRKIITTIFLCIALIACNRNGSNSSAIMPPELDSILDEYIANNPKRNVFNIVFENRNHKQFFYLQSYPDFYDGNFVDGCFIKNGKIIIFWSINKSWKDSLLHIPQEELCFDSLAKYSDINKVGVHFDGSPNHLTYRILSVNKYRKAEDSDWSYPEPACDSNVISSAALNKIVNDFINTNDSPTITYLRFSNVNGDNFVSIGYDIVYNPETFSGMFYRNGRIVIVYSLDNIRNLDIIDRKSLLPIQTISDYRSIKRKFPRFPEKKYRIVSKGKMERITSDNSIWMDI